MSTQIKNLIDTSEANVVIVLGDFVHEGLTAQVRDFGYLLINKRLRSTPRNWERIVEVLKTLNNEKRVAMVIGYLPTPTMLFIADKEYDSVRPLLISELERTKSLIFVYEDLLRGEVEPPPWEIEDTEGMLSYVSQQTDSTEDVPVRSAREQWLEAYKEEIERSNKILLDLSSRKIELLPFRRRNDVIVHIYEALDDLQAGVFLRLYVPNGRYQSEQFEDFLSLFSRYLRDVEGQDFSIDVTRTTRGQMYIFRSLGDPKKIEDLRDATSRFDNFLVIVQNDREAAENILRQRGVSPYNAEVIVEKYAREYRRLKIDIRHEFERSHLLLSQQLESELLDAIEDKILPMPRDQYPSGLFNIIGNSAPISISLAPGSLPINSMVAIEDVVIGGVTYNDEDKAIISRLAYINDEDKANQLRSDLERIKDPETPHNDKTSAGQRLKALIYSTAHYLGKKADEIGTQVLISYIEYLTTGRPQV